MISRTRNGIPVGVRRCGSSRLGQPQGLSCSARDVLDLDGRPADGEDAVAPVDDVVHEAVGHAVAVGQHRHPFQAVARLDEADEPQPVERSSACGAAVVVVAAPAGAVPSVPSVPSRPRGPDAEPFAPDDHPSAPVEPNRNGFRLSRDGRRNVTDQGFDGNVDVGNAIAATSRVASRERSDGCRTGTHGRRTAAGEQGAADGGGKERQRPADRGVQDSRDYAGRPEAVSTLPASSRSITVCSIPNTQAREEQGAQ